MVAEAARSIGDISRAWKTLIKMISKYGYWKMKPLESYSHEELCEIVVTLSEMREAQRKEDERDV